MYVLDMKGGYVYILASDYNGTLYIGVTTNLPQRVWQHKQHLTESFSSKYHVTHLVWYESHDTIENAIVREKQLKKWERKWKLRLINEFNPQWDDLYESIT